MYKHIFFDLDHTLWDFEQNSKNTLEILYYHFDLANRGVPNFYEFYTCFKEHNERLWIRFRNGYIKRNELRWRRFWYTLIDYKLPNNTLANEMSMAFLEILPQQKTLMPFAKEAIIYCASKYKLHVITNGFETTQLQKLNTCGIGSYFNKIITSEKSKSLKPKKEIFEYAMSECNVNTASECVMIGDNIDIDIVGAQTVNWDTIFYNPQQLTHIHKPSFEIKSLKELLQIL